MTKTAVTFALVLCALPALAQDMPNWHEVEGGAWQVPPGMLADAAARVNEAASTWQRRGPRPRDVGDYEVQYQGVTKDGVRVLRMMGACHASPVPATLATRWHIVLDGGNCYYSAAYDPASKSIIYFSFNGVG